MSIQNMSKRVVTVTGPSGSGKTELLNFLTAEGFEKLVSVTTRLPRPGEVEGKDYYFISQEEFLKLKIEGRLVQWVEFQGNLYATTSDEVHRVIETGRTPVVIVEPRGISEIYMTGQSMGYSLFSVYIGASLTTLIQRYLERQGIIKPGTGGYHARRIAAIFEEQEKWFKTWRWDYYFSNNSDDISDLEKAAKNIAEIVKGDL